jgi:hypothetical protein
VAWIEELSAKIEEAKGLRQKAVNEVAATWHTYLKSIIENGLKIRMGFKTDCRSCRN